MLILYFINLFIPEKTRTYVQLKKKKKEKKEKEKERTYVQLIPFENILFN